MVVLIVESERHVNGRWHRGSGRGNLRRNGADGGLASSTRPERVEEVPTSPATYRSSEPAATLAQTTAAAGTRASEWVPCA